MKVEALIKVPAAHAIAAEFGSIWVSSGGEGGSVTRIDPKSNEVVATIETDPSGFPDRMTAADGLLWVGQFQLESIVGIDPDTNEVVGELPAGNGAAVIATGFGDLWTGNYYDYDVWRLDPSER
jgi:streptogramin lyase